MLSKKYSNFWQKVIDMVLNSVFYAYRRIIQKKYGSVNRRNIFMSFSDVERNIIVFLSKKVSAGFSSKLSACPEQQSEENHFFEKKILSKFSDFVGKLNWFWQKLFNKIVKTAL